MITQWSKPLSTNSKQQQARDPGMPAFLALAALVLLPACRQATEPPAAEVRPVRAITIETRAVGDVISLTGTVQAQTEINESFRIGGRLIERNVEVGDQVRPGQVLARLDPQNEESSLQASRAQLVAAQAQLVEARNNHARMRDLVAENAVSRAAFDQAVAVLQTAESQVNSARASVNLAENRLSYTQLNATSAGVVTARGAEPGEVVGAGSMVVQVAREGARDAVFDVPAQIKNSAVRKAGITVALVDDPKVTATGTVREVSPRADPVTGTFAVRVQLLDPPPTMRLGSTVTGRVQLDSAPTIQVPATALMRADGGTAVWVYDTAAGTVAARSITVAGSNATTVQVASGLNAGDVVVTAGVQALRPGQKVRLLEAPQP
jgi:RND family efflux transporter MFP subunit